MRKIWATFTKEVLLLWRDKMGLIILFILPMCLVLFITMTTTKQGNNHQQKINLILLDQDHGALSKTIITALNQVTLFNIIEQPDTPEARNIINNQISKGKYSLALIIPNSTTMKTNHYIQKQIQNPLLATSPPPALQILVDPGLSLDLKGSVDITLQAIFNGIETQMTAQLLAQSLHRPKIPFNSNFINYQMHYVSLDDQAKAPNSVEYNVPAWTLFGMFFIVIPLAGVMVRERELGMPQRLEIAPTWHLNLMLGRIFAFIVLNMVQLWLMLAVGVFILPLFGMPTLEVADHITLIFITGLFASLAATGFGLLIGTWASTYEQATVLGAFLIVIAAAIGGIMAPIDLMPALLQKISAYSPLNWAQTAFLNIFVRNANWSLLWPEWAKLFCFFILTMLLSWLKFVHFLRRT